MEISAAPSQEALLEQVGSVQAAVDRQIRALQGANTVPAAMLDLLLESMGVGQNLNETA